MTNNWTMFFLRFDSHDFSYVIQEQKNNLTDSVSVPLEERAVVNGLKHSRVDKSPGPGNIDSRVLISCEEQLGHIFHYIFQLSFSRQKVPKIWKQSTVIPVAKHNNPKELNDYRPTGWILVFSTDRTQRVRVNGCLSGEMLSSSGSPRGCALSPPLYIL